MNPIRFVMNVLSFVRVFGFLPLFLTPLEVSGSGNLQKGSIDDELDLEYFEMVGGVLIFKRF